MKEGGRRRGACEGACTGATMPQPSTLRLIRSVAAFGCRESDFALQRLEECRAFETEHSLDPFLSFFLSLRSDIRKFAKKNSGILPILANCFSGFFFYFTKKGQDAGPGRRVRRRSLKSAVRQSGPAPRPRHCRWHPVYSGVLSHLSHTPRFALADSMSDPTDLDVRLD